MEALPPPTSLLVSTAEGKGDSAGIAVLAGAGVEGLLERFLARQLPSTRRAYRRDLEDFARWLGAASAQPAAERLLALPTPGPANQLVHDYVSHLRRESPRETGLQQA